MGGAPAPGLDPAFDAWMTSTFGPHPDRFKSEYVEPPVMDARFG